MKEKGKWYIKVEGKQIEVSEEVHRTYSKGERKERYMLNDLKQDRFVLEGERVVKIPSREDSYDRLLELDRQFPDETEPLPEDTAVKVDLINKLEQALHTLSDSEMNLIQQLFYLERTEREVCQELGIPKTTLHRLKMRVLGKLKKEIEI